MFDTRLLSSFMAVAQHKHFGKAAAALNATQPGVSQHIAKLEAQLGFKLIERTKRTVALSPAGESFYLRARHLIAMVKQMKEEGLQIANGMLGQLALGMQSSVIYSDVPHRISRFKDAHPKIKIRFEVHPGDYLKGLMDRGELDAAITTMPMPSPEYQTMVVSRQLMGVALPTAHPLATRKVLTLEALRDDAFIVVPREYDPNAHDTLIAKLHKVSTAPRIAAYETPSLNVLVRVAVGEGVALVPLGYSRDRQDAVQIVRLNDVDLGSTLIYATIRKDNVRPITERLLLALS